METIIMVMQAWMLVIALGIDAFACAFGYGASKIKIPFKAVMLINIVTSGLLSAGLFFGTAIGHFLPEEAAEWIAFGILVALGIYKLFDSAVKKAIRKRNGINKNIEFSLFKLNFLLKIYANPEAADADESKELSLREATPLAVAVGLDGLSVGFGVGIAAATANVLLIVGLSLISDILAVVLGCYLGNKIAKRLSLDLSWLSGVILIGIAVAGIIL